MHKKILSTFIFVLASLYMFASYIIVPMDEKQKNHLKAYGIAYWIIENQIETYWLLNYRGGSFGFPHSKIFEKECLTRGVSFEIIPDVQFNH